MARRTIGRAKVGGAAGAAVGVGTRKWNHVPFIPMIWAENIGTAARVVRRDGAEGPEGRESPNFGKSRRNPQTGDQGKREALAEGLGDGVVSMRLRKRRGAPVGGSRRMGFIPMRAMKRESPRRKSGPFPRRGFSEVPVTRRRQIGDRRRRGGRVLVPGGPFRAMGAVRGRKRADGGPKPPRLRGSLSWPFVSRPSRFHRGWRQTHAVWASSSAETLTGTPSNGVRRVERCTCTSRMVLSTSMLLFSPRA